VVLGHFAIESGDLNGRCGGWIKGKHKNESRNGTTSQRDGKYL